MEFEAKSTFEICVDTFPEMLRKPPDQFRHLNLLFAPFGVTVGEIEFPASIWTDFAGVLLYRWRQSVWEFMRGHSAMATLPFWYFYEIQLRHSSSDSWKLTLVENIPGRSKKTQDALVIPEAVESELIGATKKLLAGARFVDRWTDDCEALQSSLDGGEQYWERIRLGTLEDPDFLYGRIPSPHTTRRPGSEFPEPLVDRLASKPFFCFRCEGKLGDWLPGQNEQQCPECGQKIRL